ncbi:peptide-methionine (S)-S-oxide reductase MsrA [Paenibacillus humicus]|uniref:peptide-methionine (S)-S-oxide reductase MsrA n=1 Tax=Paenibacillus humicus TaxID=412861 RepID=UPI003F1723DE
MQEQGSRQNAGLSGTAAFAMGCFWGPEALFGSLPGVLRTVTGYAGGTSPDPDYRRMGDHSETVQLEYDPSVISYRELLDLFWSSHNPANINGYKDRQYQSIVFWSGREQLEAIREKLSGLALEGKPVPDTEIAEAAEFWVAEERHQKHALKRFPDAVSKLDFLFPSRKEWEASTLAARLNGLAKGYTNRQRILEEIDGWELAEGRKRLYAAALKEIRW